MMLLEVPDLGNVKIGAACGIAPTLRTEREEWGTHIVGCLRVIERLGHPPSCLSSAVMVNPRVAHPFSMDKLWVAHPLRGLQVVGFPDSRPRGFFCYPSPPYDDADRLTAVTDPANNTTQYAYDTESDLTTR